MATDTESLGVCPECGTVIDPVQILIEYEQADGTLGQFAECVACDEVVKPA